MTILSVNKTRELMGAMRSFFIGMGAFCAHFSVLRSILCVKIPVFLFVQR